MCYHSDAHGKGIPIGSLTSQLFANIYLSPLDNFVKHMLKAKLYIRYMDDFLLLHQSEVLLNDWKRDICTFLKTLKLRLHEEKSRTFPLCNGINFLGYRTFYYHRLLRKNAAMMFENNLRRNLCDCGGFHASHEATAKKLEGWFVYASYADTYNLRRNMIEKLTHRSATLLADP